MEIRGNLDLEGNIGAGDFIKLGFLAKGYIYIYGGKYDKKGLDKYFFNFEK